MNLVLTEVEHNHVIECLKETILISANFKVYEKEFLESLQGRIEKTEGEIQLSNSEREMLRHSLLDVIVNSDTVDTVTRDCLTGVHQRIQEHELKNDR